MWIHLHRRSAPWCVRLEDKLKKTVVLDRPGLVISDLYEFLEQVSDVSKKHVVFLDGLVESIHRDELVVCSGWLNDDRVKRRLVLVSSMTYRGKMSEKDDDMMNVKEYFVSSWTLNECLEGTQDDELFASVKPRLDACTPLPVSVTESIQHPTREALVRSKYYFASGSAPYMFDFGVAKVVGLLK